MRKKREKSLWSISSYLWLNLCFQIQTGVRLISGMAVTECKMQLKDTGFSYAAPDTFTWGLIQTPSSKTLMWSRTHGFHSHRFIPLLCVLNRSLVLSSVGSPIPLLILSHGALLPVDLIPLSPPALEPHTIPLLSFSRLWGPLSKLNPCSFTCQLWTSRHYVGDLILRKISWNGPPRIVVAQESSLIYWIIITNFANIQSILLYDFNILATVIRFITVNL